MKIILTPELRKQGQQAQMLKCAVTLSMVFALSACGSIQYNGFSKANTIFDVFSIAETEDSAGAESGGDVEVSNQAEQVAEQKSETQNNTAAIAFFSQLDPENDTLRNELREAEKEEAAALENTSVEMTASAQPSLKKNVTETAEAAEAQAERLQAKIVKAESSIVIQEISKNDVDTTLVSKAPAPEQFGATLVDKKTDTKAAIQTKFLATAEQSPTIAIQGDTGTASESLENEKMSLSVASVEDVNRITEQSPTAAISSDYQVLPEVQAEVAEISVPTELLLLAGAAEYRPEVSEYGMWTIAKGENSLYRENCTLASSTMQVSFENYSTQVWLNVVGDDLLVNATTNIDINKPRVGIKLDNGPLQPFSKKHFNTSAVWSGDFNNAIKRNKKLSVILGGNELGGRTQEVTVELDDLRRAYLEYTKCNATRQIGSL